MNMRVVRYILLHRALLLGWTFAFVIATVGWVRWQPATYRASTSIVVRANDANAKLSGSDLYLNLGTIVRSRLLLTRALSGIDASLLPLTATTSDAVGVVQQHLDLLPTDSADTFRVVVTSLYPTDNRKLAIAIAEATASVLSSPVAGFGSDATDLEQASLKALLHYRAFTDRSKFIVELLTVSPLYAVALALLAGLCAGFAHARARDVIRGNIYSARQVERAVSLPVVGHLPLLPRKLSPALKCFTPQVDSLGPTAVACRAALLKLRSADSETLPRTIAVTSVDVGEGRTTCAANLAVAIALSGRKVLLVDADVHAPMTHQIFSISRTAGLCQALLLPEDAHHFAQPTHIPGLQVMPLGQLTPSSLARLQGQLFRQMVDTLNQHFDTVIFDTATWKSGPDTAAIAGECRLTLLVLRSSLGLSSAKRAALRSIKTATARPTYLFINALPYDGREAGFGVNLSMVPRRRPMHASARDRLHNYGYAPDYGVRT